MIKQYVIFNQFLDAFNDKDRNDNFSYRGLKALYEWIEQFDDDCGTDTELDVIALCCEFSELSYDEVASQYDIEFDIDSRNDDIESYLSERTSWMQVDSETLIIQDF